MLGLCTPGSRVWLSRSEKTSRKLAYSWELIEIDIGRGPALVGINTNAPNGAVAAAIRANLLPPLAGYDTLRREVRYGTGCRIDILLEAEGRPPCYVEVKNAHMMRHAGLAEFPDSVTARGTRHLAALADVATAGARAVMLFLVQRGDADAFALAADIDPAYAKAFADARGSGVEAHAIACTLTMDGLMQPRAIPIVASRQRPAIAPAHF